MATLMEQASALVAVPHTNRLRCDGCHRFVGTVGTEHIVDERCGVRYILTIGGSYVRVER